MVSSTAGIDYPMQSHIRSGQGGGYFNSFGYGGYAIIIFVATRRRHVVNYRGLRRIMVEAVDQQNTVPVSIVLGWPTFVRADIAIFWVWEVGKVMTDFGQDNHSG
jgi:hypothetical protein